MKGFTLIPISSAVLALCVAGNAMAYTLTTQIQNMTSWSGQTTPAIIEACASDSHAGGHKCGDYSKIPLVEVSNSDLKGDYIEAGFRLNDVYISHITFDQSCSNYFNAKSDHYQNGNAGLYEMKIPNNGNASYNFMAQIQYDSHGGTVTMSHCVLEILNT